MNYKLKQSSSEVKEMKYYLMSCGHVSNAVAYINDEKVPCCAICNNTEIVREVQGTDGLEGRFSTCGQHKGGGAKPVQSRWELPFFEYRPNDVYDNHYCGCWGWD